MQELIIYHVTNEEIKDVLAIFCNSLYQQNMKSIIVFNSIETMEECDKRIWTFSSDKFIPHCTILDKMDKEMQYFYLTDRVENYPSFSSLCFVFQDDDMKSHIDKILNSKFENNIEKVAYMFCGIDKSENYIKEMNMYEINNKFSTCKFFNRENGNWTKII